MKQGDSSVREYNTTFLAGGLPQYHDQETLVKMYRNGLREDIRSVIGSTEFSTIDDIMHASLGVEEGESKMKQGDSPVREYNTSFLAGGYDAFESCTPNTEEEGSEEASDSEGYLKDY
ncbi:hypothetical protein DY000_02010231 [Brassica cretica]|uniref:Retrotransposon gag domain-containing protein n=1 Tax=Brassica cretica TaxID=69181 RepID=A0ABQ7CH01_BRACR|nr:hypothetical protein DY000_02010231 [Brassica cretica]